MQQNQGETPKILNSTSVDLKLKPAGLIYPPAEIRKIADKTAEFVAKNGPSFEELVIKAEANNIKFSFLKVDDPYRNYYDHKVSEFLKNIESTQQPAKIVVSQSESSSTGNNSSFIKPNPTPNPIVINQASSFLSNYQIGSRPDFKKEIKQPPPDQYSVEHPLNVMLLDLDIIKHTAQFVAKNGQKFLIALTEREKQNPQFEFLKPNHALFSFFTNLVDAYSKCIMPKKEELQKLQINVQDRMGILNRAGERFEFENMQKQVKKKKEEIDEEERIQMAQIDWNDFIVVETIDLFENEELPAPHYFDKHEKPEDKEKPASPKRVEPEDKRLFKPTAPTAQNTVEILPQPEQLVPLPLENDLKVRKNYIRKSGNSDNATVKCEVCGHNIPVNEYNEHLRIELMDPKHQQMKTELNQRSQNTATATGEELSANLQMFSKKRPDIFGTVEEQFSSSDKKKPEKILWDGHSNTMTRTTANVAMLQQQTKKNIEESLKSTEKSVPAKPQPQIISNPLPNPPVNSLNKTLLEDVKTTIPSTEEKNKGLPPNFSNFEKISHNNNMPPIFAETKETMTSSNVSMNLNQNNPSHSNINSSSVQNINLTPLSNPQVPVGMLKAPLIPLLMDSTRLIKEENINLIPEERWLDLNPNHIQINIKIPDNGGEEPWSFNGQVVQLEVDPRTTIGNIKDILSGILGGMPTQKQKLKSNLFSVLKDNHSLAYYNMINGLVLELSVKERGGRARNK